MSVGISIVKGLKSLGENSFFLLVGSRGTFIDEKSGNTGRGSDETEISGDRLLEIEF